MKTINLTSVAKRADLAPRREPYYVNLRRGCALGFRKMNANSQGTWVARYTESGTNVQTKESFGTFEDRLPSERYEAAKDAAEAWFDHLGAGGTTKVVTVQSACEEYVKHHRSKDQKKGDEIGKRYERWVYPDQTLAPIELRKLTAKTLETWRKRLRDTEVVVNPHAEVEKQVRRARKATTVNRDVAALRAALNYAHGQGIVVSDLAWLNALKAEPGVDAAGQRDLYLDKDQRRAMVAKSSEEFRPFVNALCILPLRPGALAALTVGQLQQKLRVLSIKKDKVKGQRRIALPQSTVDALAESCDGKEATDYLLSRGGKKKWTKDAWKGPIKEAANAAELPAETVAYTLRHSVITDLVVTGLDLLTVAQLSGTSVEMIERHYGHLRPSKSVQALESLSL